MSDAELKHESIERKLWIVPAVIVLLWILTWVLSVYGLPGWEYRGRFGDMFGSIHSLFSGLALAGIVVALLLQKNQLALQKNELALQRNELASQREELALARQELQRSADAQRQSEAALKTQTQALHETAKIEALAALLNAYVYVSGVSLPDRDQKRRNCIKELEKALAAAGVGLSRN